MGFLLCQGEIVSINIIIYWELLGPPRVFLFFPVRTSPVRTSHPCVILSFPFSVQAAESSVWKIPREHTGWRQLLLQETAEDRDGKRHVWPGWQAGKIATSQCPTGRRQNSQPSLQIRTFIIHCVCDLNFPTQAKKCLRSSLEILKSQKGSLIITVCLRPRGQSLNGGPFLCTSFWTFRTHGSFAQTHPHTPTEEYCG